MKNIIYILFTIVFSFSCKPGHLEGNPYNFTPLLIAEYDLPSGYLLTPKVSYPDFLPRSISFSQNVTYLKNDNACSLEIAYYEFADPEKAALYAPQLWKYLKEPAKTPVSYRGIDEGFSFTTNGDEKVTRTYLKTKNIVIWMLFSEKCKEQSDVITGIIIRKVHL